MLYTYSTFGDADQTPCSSDREAQQCSTLKTNCAYTRQLTPCTRTSNEMTWVVRLISDLGGHNSSTRTHAPRQLHMFGWYSVQLPTYGKSQATYKILI